MCGMTGHHGHGYKYDREDGRTPVPACRIPRAAIRLLLASSVWLNALSDGTMDGTYSYRNYRSVSDIRAGLQWHSPHTLLCPKAKRQSKPIHVHTHRTHGNSELAPDTRTVFAQRGTRACTADVAPSTTSGVHRRHRLQTPAMPNASCPAAALLHRRPARRRSASPTPSSKAAALAASARARGARREQGVRRG